ncbi:Uncharacterised protein [Klebsiella aerogenes]|nr:Uncharacterised protein [Klebsiella aerogenes]
MPPASAAAEDSISAVADGMPTHGPSAAAIESTINGRLICGMLPSSSSSPASPPTASVVPMVEKNSEAKKTNRNGRKAMFNAPNRSTCPSTGVSEWGTSIKLVGKWVTPKGMPTSVAHRMAHKIAPGTLRACRAIARNRPHSATSAPGARKSPSISALVSHWPAPARHCESRGRRQTGRWRR